MKRKTALLTVAACLGVAAQSFSDVIVDWNNITLQAIKTAPFTPPPKSSRALAMVHVAMFDAVNAVYGKYRPYSIPSNTLINPGTSPDAAAIQAAYLVLLSLYPAQSGSLATAYTNSLNAIPNSQSKTDGITLGAVVASKVIAMRTGDHSGDVVAYVPGSNPGDWIPTPPGFLAALLPNWPLVTCFCMGGGAEFRGAGPPALNSTAYTTAFNEVKSLGRNTGSTRTADQSAIALYWADGGGTITPPGHWNWIAQIVSSQKHLNLLQNARLFALLNLAEADSAICAWDNKYEYNFWRPVTAIQKADLDGNAATTKDAAWLSFITTPNFPEYSSGHSTFSAAAAQVLASYFGTDFVSFTCPSDGGGPARSFNSFTQAANEAGRSRIYGGIHYEFSNQEGQSSGRKIGKLAFEDYLQPYGGSAGAAVLFNSPAGAFIPIPSSAGLAVLGVSAFSAFGPNNPVGQVNFSFGPVGFLSTGLDELVTSGTRAEILAHGKVNGNSGYVIRVVLSDGGNAGDHVRVQLYSVAIGLLYDNQLPTPNGDTLYKPGTVVVFGNAVVQP